MIRPSSKYCDADFAGCEDTRRSTTGYIFNLAGGPISWNAKRQTLCTESTSEAEYVALASAVNDSKYLRQILAEIGQHQLINGPTTIHEDNTGAIQIANNPMTLGRTKHLNIKYHRVREAVDKKAVSITHISTDMQRADLFTKALSPKTFVMHRDAIMSRISKDSSSDPLIGEAVEMQSDDRVASSMPIYASTT